MQVNLSPKFPLGQVACTPGVLALLALPQSLAAVELQPILMRHQSGDWGDMPAEDCESNERALIHGSRLMSAYEHKGEKVWIITEADRSVTTILLPDEY
jgi:hypothetical protein